MNGKFSYGYLGRILAPSLGIVAALLIPPDARASLTDNTPGAMRVSAYGEYLRVPDAASLNLTSTITLETWYRFDGTEHQPGIEIVKRGGGTVGSGISNGYGIKIAPDQVFGAGIFGQRVFYGPTQPLDHDWHYFAWTLDGSVGRVFFDGQQVYQDNYSGQMGTTTSDLIIGQGVQEDGSLYPPVDNGNATDEEGFYDEIRLWNVARTPAQIAATWNTPLTGSEPNLVGFWNFDNLNGLDGSAFGNNGTAVGGAQFVAVPEPCGALVAFTIIVLQSVAHSRCARRGTGFC